MKLKKLLVILFIMIIIPTALFVSCKKDDGNDVPGEPDINGGEESDNPSECKHEETEIRNQKEATCKDEGYTGDTYCKKCGAKIAEGKTIPKTEDHIFRELEVIKPTCQKEGQKNYECIVCGKKKSETIPKVDHELIYTDLKDGTHKITCKNCGLVNNTEKHVPKDANGVKVEPTCTEYGYTEFECKYCKVKYRVTAESDKPLGHNFGEWEDSKIATCSTKGEKIRRCTNKGCTVCEKIETPINPYNHASTHVEKLAATCTNEGRNTYICDECGEIVKIENIAVKPHNFGDVVKDGDGYSKKVCIDCGYTVTTYDASAKKECTVETNTLPSLNNMEVKLENADILLPNMVIEQIKSGGSTLKIAANVLDETAKNNVVEKLTPEQKKAIGDGNIYDFGLMVDDKSVTNDTTLFKEKVKVTLPYELKEGEDPRGVVVWYVNDKGEATSVPAKYDSASKTVSFETDHFSFYAIAYELPPVVRCELGNHTWEIDKKMSKVPTCSETGYTAYKCVYCGAIKIDDFKDPLGHKFGETIVPEVTCSEGVYSYKECSVCGYREKIEYFAPKPHTVTVHATCTEDGICDVCGMVAEKAKGHTFGEWEIVKQPTETEVGLKKRTCSVCGYVQEVTTAIEETEIVPLNFESYDDVLQSVFGKIYQNGSGTLELEMEITGTKVMCFKITAEKTEKGYIAYIAAGQGGYSLEMYYKCGRMYGISFYGSSGKVTSADIETYLGISFENIKTFITAMCNAFNPYIEEQFINIKSQIKSITDEKKAAIDKVFADLKMNCTVDSIYMDVCKMEGVYAYVAKKLGYETDIPAGSIDSITEEEIVKLLGTYITKEQIDGRTVYKFAFDPIKEKIEPMLKWIKDRETNTLDQIVFEIWGEKIKANFEGVTDFKTFIDYIKLKLPGDTKVKVLIDKVLNYIDSSNVMTVEQFYDYVNKIVKMTPDCPPDFDIRVMIQNVGEITLNALVENAVASPGATFEMLLDEIYNLLSTYTLYNIPLPQTFPFTSTGEFIGTIEGIAGTYGTQITFEVQKTKDGKYALGNFLVSVTEKSGDPLVPDSPVLKLTYVYKTEGEIKVELPKDTDLLPENIKTSVDSEGNYIVDFGKDVEVENLIFPELIFAPEEVFEADEKMSERTGLNVYTYKDEFRPKRNINIKVVSINGKYYRIYEQCTDRVISVDKSCKLADFGKNFSDLYPSENDEVVAIYENGGNSYPVYETYFGNVFNDGNAWQLIENNSTQIETRDGVNYIVYCEYTPFDSLKGGSFKYITCSNYNKILLNGQVCEEYYGFWENSGVDRTVYFARIGGEFYAIIRKFNDFGTYNFVNYLGEEIVIKEKDVFKSSDRKVLVKNSNGEYTEYETGMVIKNQGKINDEYFAKLGNKYFRLRQYNDDYMIYSVVDTDIPNLYKEVKYLPDGNEMYVVTTYGNHYIGYVKLEDGYYARAIALYNYNGEFSETEFEDNVYTQGKKCIYLYDYLENSDFEKTGAGKYKINAYKYDLIKNHISDFGKIFADIVYGNDYARYMIFDSDIDSYIPDISIQDIVGSIQEPPVYYDWEVWFGSFEKYIIPQNDGSLDVFISNEHGCDYWFEGNLDINKTMFEKEISEQMGMKIYSANRVLKDHKDFILKDGKYYEYSINSKIRFMSEKESYNLVDIYELYDMQIIARTADGATEDIYSARFGDNKGLLYFKIDTDGIKVLLDVKPIPNGYSYESVVTYKEFCALIENNMEVLGTSVEGYMMPPTNSVVKKLYWKSEFNGYRFEGISCFYTENGKKIYINPGFIDSDRTIVLGKEIKFGDNLVPSAYSTISGLNGEFTLVTVNKLTKDYFLKVGTKLTYIDIVCEDGIWRPKLLPDFEFERSVIEKISTKKEGLICTENGINYELEFVNGKYVKTGNTVGRDDISGFENYDYSDFGPVYKYIQFVKDYQTETLPDGTLHLYRTDRNIHYLKISKTLYLYVEDVQKSGDTFIPKFRNSDQEISVKRYEGFADVVLKESRTGENDIIYHIDKDVVDLLKENPDVMLVIVNPKYNIRIEIDKKIFDASAKN